ncbi:MAG: lipoyl(octanoyl) transferase LipB [Betaproteobacteria bacterium]|nr:lipoyl(octanoyl) transferase LipB [Betaproteobacteria bacterium]
MKLQIRHLGTRDYSDCLSAMQRFTRSRDPTQDDEIWLLQHPPVFTLGKASRAHHLLDPGDIPVIASERGGQISYHGPGQLIAYVLLNLARRELMVRQLVSLLEQSCIDLLKSWGIDSQRRSQAPGVYLAAGSGSDEALSGRIENSIKIAALGLKVSRSCSYHGLALNVAMDLSPFSRIDPCGYPGLAVTDMKSCLGYAPDFGQVQAQLAASITASLQAHDRERTTPYEQQP